MHNYGYLLFTLLFVSAVGVSAAEPETGIDLVTRQFVENQLRERGIDVKDPKTAPKVDALVASLGEDGAWGDIDYHSTQRATWPTGNHLSRVLQMAVAWSATGKPAELATAIHRALGYWLAHDYQCPNWWYNQIGGPQAMFTTALLLGDELRPEERTYFIQTVLPRAKIGMTWQNKVWLAGNTLMGGLLQRDDTLVKTAAEVIFAEMAVATKEGIQPDFSFHQHGAQQQLGNYGLAFAGEMTKWGDILRGSPWAMPSVKLEILRKYLLDGESWISAPVGGSYPPDRRRRNMPR